MSKDYEDLYKKMEAISAVVVDMQMRLDAMTPRNKNKDGIPIGTEVSAEIAGQLVVLEAEQNGYRVKTVGETPIASGIKYSSLSAAAEKLSGIKRKSGWVFWRDVATGKTLKEQYKG